jgi:hypothetical protein
VIDFSLLLFSECERDRSAALLAMADLFLVVLARNAERWSLAVEQGSLSEDCCACHILPGRVAMAGASSARIKMITMGMSEQRKVIQ